MLHAFSLVFYFVGMLICTCRGNINLQSCHHIKNQKSSSILVRRIALRSEGTIFRTSALRDSLSGKSESIDEFSISDIEKYGLSMGISIKSKVQGPYLRLDAFQLGDDTQPIGYLSAFIRPGIFHLDTIQVKNRRQVFDFKREGWKVDGPGMSFLMGSWALCWASSKGVR